MHRPWLCDTARLVCRPDYTSVSHRRGGPVHDIKDMVKQFNSNRIGSLIKDIRPKQEDNEPPVGPAMGTISPELSAQVREFRGSRNGD